MAELEHATIGNSIIFSEATISGVEIRRTHIDGDCAEPLKLSGVDTGAHTCLNGNWFVEID